MNGTSLGPNAGSGASKGGRIMGGYIELAGVGRFSVSDKGRFGEAVLGRWI